MTILKRGHASTRNFLFTIGFLLATASLSFGTGEAGLERDDLKPTVEAVSFVRQSRCAGSVSTSGGAHTLSGGIGIMSGRTVGKSNSLGILPGQDSNSNLLSPSIALELIKDYLWIGMSSEVVVASLDFSGDGVIDILDLSICIERLNPPVTTTRKDEPGKKPGLENQTSTRGGTLENE